MQVILLSWPPSTNALWRSYKGRNILSARGRMWYQAAGLELMAQGAFSITGPVWVDIAFRSPTKRSFDLDNRIKAILDALVKNLVIDGDESQIVRKLTVSAAKNIPVGATVTIRSYDGYAQ